MPFQNMFSSLRTMQEQMQQMFGGMVNNPGGPGAGAGTGRSGPLNGWPFSGMNGDWGSWLQNMGMNPGGMGGIPSQSQSSGSIPVDVYETGEEVIVIAEIPGLNSARDVTLSVFAEEIIISGKIDRPYSQSGTMRATERFSGSFERRVDLPVRVKRSGARARYQSGLLEIRLAKSGYQSGDKSASVPIDFR
ncbi:Hsp20/alpha crystallin family protein [Alicyclobacillus ferrooxydans]|nr:Hsp20/alpha crystallin family protein [Alicyclobacillus ferrooxydans]